MEGSTGLLRGTPNTALDDVCTTLRTPAPALGQQQRRAVDVDRAQQLLVLGQRHLGHVVEHHVGTVDGCCHHLRIADVALHQLDLRRAVVDVVEVEHADGVAGGDEAVDEQRPEVAAATGDERDAHSSSP